MLNNLNKPLAGGSIKLKFLLLVTLTLADFMEVVVANTSKSEDSEASPRGHLVSALFHKTPAAISNSVPVRCLQDNDLIIAIDESTSVGAPSFQIALQFAATLAETWRSHPGNGVAVIFFATGVRPFIDLPTGLTLTPEAIRNQILAATYSTGATDTDQALNAAATELALNGRPQIPHNLVVLTDGMSRDSRLTQMAAASLYAMGTVRGFSIGIGPMVDQAELLTIANNRQDRSFRINSFDQLLNLLRPLTTLLCQP